MKLGPDTYAVLRNTATFEAYREYQRRARRAGQPFLSIALGLYVMVIAAFVWVLATGFHVEAFRAIMLPMEAGLFIGGVSFALAGIRISLWLWSHPQNSQAQTTAARTPPGRPSR